MSQHFYHVGESVAIMPTCRSPEGSVLEITTVHEVSGGLIHLQGGRTYERWSGSGVTSNSLGVMVPATAAHRTALAVC
jgi:hypothetical protein